MKALQKIYYENFTKALQKLYKIFIKRLHVYMFLKEDVDIFNDTLIGCFAYFQNVIG